MIRLLKRLVAWLWRDAQPEPQELGAGAEADRRAVTRITAGSAGLRFDYDPLEF